MKNIFIAFLVMLTSAFAEIKQATIAGDLFQETGDFYRNLSPSPFVLTYQFDTEAFDWNPSPELGSYHSFLPWTLKFAGLEFGDTGTWVTVSSDAAGLNRGFIFWSDASSTQNGFKLAPLGLYIQFNVWSPTFVINDSLDSVQTYNIESGMSIERFYMIDEAYGLTEPGGNRLLSDTYTGIHTFHIDVVPEPSAAFLALPCALGMMYLTRRRKIFLDNEPDKRAGAVC